MILIGTCGYSYDDWVGPFYPSGLRKGDWLPFYAEHFDAVELNFSFYRMPTAQQMDGMVRRTDGKLVFVVKSPQEITHQRGDTLAVVESFMNAVKPMKDAGVLGGVLLQFPFSFRFVPENTAYLDQIVEAFEGVDLIVEFRHDSWVKPEVVEYLKGKGVAFCNVDEPHLHDLIRKTEFVTSNIGYVRFHGRNAKTWWKGDSAQRYNYLYTPNELLEWKESLRTMSGKVDALFLFTNNHYGGNAVKNAMDLQAMMGVEKPKPPVETPLFEGET
jgi:uncharacterized protein YecE (DUF72 family)